MNGAPTGVAYHQPSSKSGEANNRSGNEPGISRSSGSKNNEGNSNSNVRSSGSFVRPLVPRLPYARTLRHQLCVSLRSWLQQLGVLERLGFPSEPLTTPDSLPQSYWTSSISGDNSSSNGRSGRSSSASRKVSSCDESSLAPLLDLEPALRDGSLLCAVAEVLAKDAEDGHHRTNPSSGWFLSPENFKVNHDVSNRPMLTALRGWDLRPVRIIL